MDQFLCKSSHKKYFIIEIVFGKFVLDNILTAKKKDNYKMETKKLQKLQQCWQIYFANSKSFISPLTALETKIMKKLINYFSANKLKGKTIVQLIPKTFVVSIYGI